MWTISRLNITQKLSLPMKNMHNYSTLLKAQDLHLDGFTLLSMKYAIKNFDSFKRKLLFSYEKS